MRAMKNYAGHRLSPWLGHLMVSRQETARPLLTSGEVMQLPATDELVLVSGCPPIRAKKARYFEDPRLQRRIMRPPAPGELVDQAEPRPDDWSATAPIAPPQQPATSSASSGGDDEANAGLRREPNLPEQVAIAPEDSEIRREFAFDPAGEEEPDDEAVRARTLQRRFRAVARQAALDPGDGIEL